MTQARDKTFRITAHFTDVSSQRRTTGDQPQEVEWPTGGRRSADGGSIVQKELNETVVRSREEIEERLETEDRRQLGDISDEVYLHRDTPTPKFHLRVPWSPACVHVLFLSFLRRKGQPLASRQGSSHDVSTMILRGIQIRSSFLTSFLSRSGNIFGFRIDPIHTRTCIIWPRPTCATWHAVQLGCTFLFVLLNLRMTTSFKVCRRNFLLGRRREMLFNVIIDFTVKKQRGEKKSMQYD